MTLLLFIVNVLLSINDTILSVKIYKIVYTDYYLRIFTLQVRFLNVSYEGFTV